MLGKRRAGWILRLIAADVATLVVCFVAAYALRVWLNRPLGRMAAPLRVYLWLLTLVVPVWIGLLALMGGYGVRWLRHSRAWLVARASVIGLVFVTAGLFLTKELDVNRSLLVLVSGASALGLWAERGLVQAWLRQRGRDGRHLRYGLVVGTDDQAAKIVAALQAYPEAGWAVRGCVALDACEPGQVVGGAPVVGTLGDLPELLEGDGVVDEVFFALHPADLERAAEALRLCENLGVDARVLVDLYRPAQAKPFVEELFGLPFFGFSPTLTRQGLLAVKRVVDVVGSLVLLLVGLPVTALVAVLIKATSPGPVLFSQERAGLHGRRFRMYKFRTMVRGAEKMRDQVAHLNAMAGPVFKATNDPRVTPLGRLLRRSSLDEVPQLMNVLKGEMSLVGPRPLPLDEVRRLKGVQRRRLAMRPGITGLWQVSGRSMVNFEEWMRLDLQYVDHWSLGLDLRILWRTISTVLSGEGAY